VDTKILKGTGRSWNGARPFLFIVILLVGASSGCALTETRPTQEMSDSSAALRAASEVQADTLAPEIYRQAREWHFKAKQEYKLKNFREAREFADRARYFAELAEFEAVRNGAKRDIAPMDPTTLPMSGAEPAPKPIPEKDPMYQPRDNKEFIESYKEPPSAPSSGEIAAPAPKVDGPGSK